MFSIRNKINVKCKNNICNIYSLFTCLVLVSFKIDFSRADSSRAEAAADGDSTFISYTKHKYDGVIRPSSSEFIEIVEEVDDNIQSNNIWSASAQLTLREQIAKQLNRKVAKNIILFLGDGMSIPTLAASRIYLGQSHGESGEESKLSFEEFPFIGLSKTYCLDHQVADSACSATAYSSGIKANYATLGVNGNVKLNDCPAGQNKPNHVSSIAAWAQKAGKATGIITTTRITHASPAAFYAHSANRHYECDADIAKLYSTVNSTQCQDIASQLILNEPGRNFNVIFGGGYGKFQPNSTTDKYGNVGERLDGLDLIDAWKKQNSAAIFIDTKEDLFNLDFENVDNVMGLFNHSHLNFHLDAMAAGQNEPTLAEMTEAAIKLLKKKEEGFFLFVEGGQIDFAHHQTKAQKALDETVQLAEAVRLATEMTNIEDTLIVVTSDHAHTMSFSGYSNKGTNVLGLTTNMSKIDKLPYTILSYANGPNQERHDNGSRFDLSEYNINNNIDYQYPSLVPQNDETHGGDDVAVFASGPWSHLFSGVYEQNVIPHFMAFASCIGDKLTACNNNVP